MPDPQLPPEVLAWPGFAGSPPVDSSLAGSGAAPPAQPHGPQSFLSPEVLQALGWQDPPPAAPSPIVAPQPGPGTRDDYHVPVSAFKPQPTASPPPAPAPPTKVQDPLQQIQQGSNAQQAAVGGQAQVARAQGGIEAAKSGEEAAILQKQADDQAAWEKDMAARQAEQAATRAKYQTAVDQAVKTEADYKVDPNRYYHNISTGKKIGNAIAIVLSSVGQAMMGNHGPNVALEMIQQAAKEDTDAQIREQEHLGKQIGLRQGALKNYMDMTGDANQAASLMQAQHLTTAASQLRATAAKYASPQAKLNAEQTALGLEAQAGALKSSVAEKLSDTAIKKQEVANPGYGLSLQKRGQDIQARQFDKTFAFDQKKEMDALAEKYAALDQKDKAAKAKQIGDEGVFNPATGDGLYTSRGKQMVAQADQLEAAARTTGDQAQAQQLAQQAKELRDTAKSTEVAVIGDKEARRDVQKQLAYAQQVVDVGAQLKQFLNSDPSSWDRDAWATAKTRYGAVVADYIKSLGANASSREFDAITEHVLNFDPDSIKSRLFSKAPAASSLDALDAIVKGGVDATLKIHGIKDGWVPRAPSEMPETSFGGQTATEVGASAAPLGLAKTDLYLSHPIAGREAFIQAPQELARTAAEQRTNAAGKSSNYGLAPTDDDAARALITRAKGSSDEERARIVDTLAQPMLKGKPFDPNDPDASPFGARPSLGAGIIHLIRDEDPKLYKEVLAKLPQYQAKAIAQFDDIFDATGKVRKAK